VIVGSDILYERGHIELLSRFIEQHANEKCEVIVVDPGRSNHAPFSKIMVANGYKHSQFKPTYDDRFKGVVLRYQRA